MKLSELLTYLMETAVSLNPDLENILECELKVDPDIRIAMQPRWPMEYNVAHAKFVNSNAEDIADIEKLLNGGELNESERGEAEEELTRLRAETQTLIYLMEGSHIGYADPTLWDTED